MTVGAGAKLLGAITVGHGAKIGANTVVIHDVPPNTTVVGNPGHPVRVEGKRPEGPDTDWVHLPDPIADAIKGLSARIAELECEVASCAAASCEDESPRCARCGPRTGPARPAAERGSVVDRPRAVARSGLVLRRLAAAPQPVVELVLA